MAKEFDLSALMSNPQQPKKNNNIFSEVVNNNNIDIYEIDIDKLDIIENQPFYKYGDEEMAELTADIKENGLYSPLVVNKNGERYTVLAGRNRYHACKELGWDKIPCKVIEVDEVKANLILVNSNLNQRHHLTLSEKAKAYRMQIECLAELKSISMTKAIEELAEQESMTKRNIFRYIKLSDLSSTLLPFVDSGNITLTSGIILVDFSFQEILAEYLKNNDTTKINDSIATSLIELQNHKEISIEVLDEFFNYKPVKERKSIKVDYSRINSIIDDSNSMTDEELEDYIINAIDYYKQNHKE